MAVLEQWVRCNLGELVKIRYLDGTLFNMDNQGTLIGVEVYNKDGTQATLQGTVSAKVLLPNGESVSINNGTLNRNKCSVILPESCYAVPGSITVMIKLTSNNTVTTLAAVVASVF